MRENTKIILPLPPEGTGKDLEMDVYARFMRHIRLSPQSRMEIKILSSIQFVADMTANSEALVTKILVDLGLRAPRFALPADYLDFADQAITRDNHMPGSATNHLRDLNRHWVHIGEDPFAGVKKSYSILDESIYEGV